MHGSDYEVEGTEYTILHNGDYSGDVKIIAPADTNAVLHHGNSLEEPHWEIELPFDLLEQLVLDRLRSELVARLEDADKVTLKKYLTAFIASQR